MARIPILNDPGQLNTGNQTIRTPDLPAVTNASIGKALGDVGSVAFDISEKAKRANDVTKLTEASLAMNKAQADFATWQQSPEGQDEKNWLPKWQSLQNDIKSTFDKEALTPDARLQLTDRFSNWATRGTIQVQASAIKDSGQRMEQSIDNAVKSKDFNAARQGVNDAVSAGLILPEQAQAKKLSIDAEEKDSKWNSYVLQRERLADPTSRTQESFNIANEKVVPGQPLSDKQMVVMRASISQGNTYPPEIMAQYQKQSSGSATRKDANVAAPAAAAPVIAPLAAPATAPLTPPAVPAPSGSGTGRMINIDIRAEQQAARGKAYEDARRAGKSDQEAQNIAASVGNEVGAAALSREEVTSAIAPRPEVASPAAGGQLQQATTGVANAEADASAAAGGGTTNVVAPSNSTVVNNNSTPTPKDTRNTESTFQKYLDRRYYPTAMR
jgi:hypothetical protein